MNKDIDNIIKNIKGIESNLKVFGLENVQVEGGKCKNLKNNEVRLFELEMDHNNLKSNVTKMESTNERLLKEIEKSRKTIELLNECLGGKVNVAEMNKASEKRQVLVQKLKSKQLTDDHPILRVLQKIKELEDFSG